MSIAALITWLLTALGGFVLLGTWVSRGGMRQQGAHQTRFPAPLIFGHFLLAAAGLVVWIIYVFTDNHTLAWTAFGILIPVAVLGLVMFARWLPTYRGRTAVAASMGGAGTGGPGTGEPPAERHLPVAVVAGHGVLAVTTVVLVLLAAMEIGG